MHHQSDPHPSTTITCALRNTAAVVALLLAVAGLAVAVATFGDYTRSHTYEAGLVGIVVAAALGAVAVALHVLAVLSARADALDAAIDRVIRAEGKVLTHLVDELAPRRRHG